MKGITQNLMIPFTFEKQENGAVFKSVFSINPETYHITKAGTPDRLEIELNIPVDKY